MLPILPKSRVAVLGAPGAGKSALCTQWAENTFVDRYEPTIEQTWRRKLLIDGNMTEVELYEVGGASDFQSLQDQAIEACSAYIVVYDRTNQASFSAAKQLLSRIRQSTRPTPKMLLVASKVDIERERSIPSAQGEDLARRERCWFVEVSAREHDTVEMMLERLVGRSYRVQVETPISDTILNASVTTEESERNSLRQSWKVWWTVLGRIFSCSYR